MPENFDGNPLIQALDAKRKAAEEAAASVPKVVSMATRQAYVPVPRRRRSKVAKPKLDENSIQLITEQLERYRAGELAGLVMVGRNRATGGFDIRIIAEPDQPEEVGAVAFYGALGLAQNALIDVALYGPDAGDEADEIGGDEP